MQGEVSVRTVDCLRGRLQAERAASRTAQENADLLDNKLKELERQLKIETKSRRKAEKKLNILKKKLESLNIPHNIISDDSAQSSSSHNSASSCLSSLAFIGVNHPEDTHPSSETTKSSSSNGEIAEQGSGTNLEHICQYRDNVDPSIIQQQSSDSYYNGVQPLISDMKKSEGENYKENRNDDHVNEFMALVPVTSPVELKDSSDGAMGLTSESVREVLDTLKQIRETIHNTLQGRRLSKVG